jgi:hypothetical protein
MDRSASGSAYQNLAELCDSIAEVTLKLRPLCNSSTALPRDERRVVRESCEVLRSVSEELIDILRPAMDGDGRGPAESHSPSRVVDSASQASARGE